MFNKSYVKLDCSNTATHYILIEQIEALQHSAIVIDCIDVHEIVRRRTVQAKYGYSVRR